MRREPHEFTIAPKFLKQQNMFFSSLFNRQLRYRSGRLDFLCMCMHAHVPPRTATTWMLERQLLIKLLNIYFFANPSFTIASNKHKNMTRIKINKTSCKSPYLSAGQKIKIILKQQQQKTVTNQDPLKMQYLIRLNLKTEGAEKCICVFKTRDKPSCVACMIHFCCFWLNCCAQWLFSMSIAAYIH